MVIHGRLDSYIFLRPYQSKGPLIVPSFDFHLLPSDITKSELWLVEAGIQMSKEQQLDYSPTNNLLKFKEGVLSGLREEDMAARIYGVTPEDIKMGLERLDLIDEYLRDFIGKPGKYYLVERLRLSEHFIDLQHILTWAKKPRGRIGIDWSPDENDINELKLVGFYYLRAVFAHMRIRDLQGFFAKKDIWKDQRKVIELNPNLEKKELAEAGIKDASDIEETDDEYYYEPRDDEGIQTPIEIKDLKEEAVWRTARNKDLKAYFEDAKEQEKIIKDTERPIALAKRALNNITAIPEDSDKLNDPEIDNILQQIITATNKLRKLIRKFCD